MIGSVGIRAVLGDLSVSWCLRTCHLARNEPPAALNATMSSAGIRPRSLTAVPLRFGSGTDFGVSTALAGESPGAGWCRRFGRLRPAIGYSRVTVADE